MINSNHSRSHSLNKNLDKHSSDSIKSQDRSRQNNLDHRQINDKNPLDPQKSNHSKWIKACHCSLIAHESCLLTWITTYQLTHSASASTPLSTPVLCPQCSTPYKIIQPDYPLLNLSHRLKKPYHAALVWAALGGMACSLAISTSSYGLWASRCFLGPNRWARWISINQGGLSFLRLFQTSLIGPILLLSRTRLIDSVFPFLPISLILSTLPPLNHDSNIRHHYRQTTNLLDPLQIKITSIFPPQPSITLCLIPWFRIGWNWAWGHLAKFIIKRQSKSLDYMGMTDPLAFQFNQHNNPQVRVEHDIIDNQDQIFQPLVGEVILDNTSLHTAICLGMEALLWPGLASCAGNLLFFLSKDRPWLRSLLGLNQSCPQHQFKASFAPYQSPLSFITSPFNQLFQIFLQSNHFNSNLSHQNLNDYNFEINSISEDEDPVWWRNTLGGAMLVVIKDVFNLLEKVMKLRKLSKRKVLAIS
ncbi:hypothetical protein O181_070137 [Austropuccinia psidii MF-1]|uniref:RING-CH-type domain-containing protein n=1 Tax=Austropuccinia psidii MF-1 TaxID=1389203 RepID=A0A9Q3F2M2_9BASI|nr:hypothetical protein [Austropuccinia psidii MF-1]